MFVTCLSTVVSDEIVIPRFLAWETNGTSELPTWIEVGAESGSIILSDLIRIDSVLSSFSRSLLQSIHNFTPKMQFCMRWTMVSNGLDGKTQEVECHQQKINWRLSDVRSSLKQWIKQGWGQSPAARKSREWMVLSCCCRWYSFQSQSFPWLSYSIYSQSFPWLG